MQVCNHPLLTYPPDGYDSSKLKQWDVPDERLVSECGKMQFLDRLFVKFARTGHRVLLFSTMTKVLDLMEVYLRWRTVDGALRLPPLATSARCSLGCGNSIVHAAGLHQCIALCVFALANVAFALRQVA